VGCTCWEKVSGIIHIVHSQKFGTMTAPTNEIIFLVYFRAWACRGVNISCKAGEVVAILGEESSGKTRLLTAVGESLASPPRRSRSINIARGKISVGGLDVTEWNKSELKHKAAIFFNDMKTVSDMARFYSGTKLDDIIGLPCPPGAHEGSIRSAIGVAAQITGLSNGLLSKLPRKFDTVVTASEDDLKSPRGQDFTLLSNAEWSKVLLTKAIAQVVIANDNPMSNPNAVSKSLVGSILLLDDLTNQLDEGEEIKLIKSLKSSGAASLITSKRWSIGMFADRIVVLKDGAVVESGTHHELMAKGSDNSIYANRWAQMLSS
jgi:ABC-type multidrug transport system fused ATPase/permease subunit